MGGQDETFFNGIRYLKQTEVVDLEKPERTCTFKDLPDVQGGAIVGFVWGLECLQLILIIIFCIISTYLYDTDETPLICGGFTEVMVDLSPTRSPTGRCYRIQKKTGDWEQTYNLQDSGMEFLGYVQWDDTMIWLVGGTNGQEQNYWY